MEGRGGWQYLEDGRGGERYRIKICHFYFVFQKVYNYIKDLAVSIIQ